MRPLFINLFFVCSSLTSWWDRYDNSPLSRRLDEDELKKNSFPWRGDKDKAMLLSYARIARINEGLRFGCSGAIISENVFATRELF